MMIVKITIMLSAILFIWTVLLRLYYNANPLDAIAMGVSINRGKLPVWFIIFFIAMGCGSCSHCLIDFLGFVSEVTI